MDVSVIVPVYNGGAAFVHCLQSLRTTTYTGLWELLVVDDGSTDGSADAAQGLATQLIVTPQPCSGPAAARNLGAQQAAGDILLFLDADVLVRPTTVGQAVAYLTTNDACSAVFGSYDDAPTCRSFLSQVKNLFHHYTHQTAQTEASTFWAGCGAVRRSAFWAVGGFDAVRYPRPMIEDIELGVRLRQHGYRIGLDKTWQVTHQKCWTLRSWLRSDLCDRGIPWWRLILTTRALPNDLNVNWRSRTAVGLSGLWVVCLLLGYWVHPLWLLAAVASLGLLRLGWPFYRWLARQRGRWFAVAAVPWHWGYWMLSAVSILAGTGQWVVSYLDSDKDRNR